MIHINKLFQVITVAAQSETWVLAACYGIVGLNPARGMDAIPCVGLSCVGKGLATGQTPSPHLQEVLPTVEKRLFRNIAYVGRPGSFNNCRATGKERKEVPRSPARFLFLVYLTLNVIFNSIGTEIVPRINVIDAKIGRLFTTHVKARNPCNMCTGNR
jgi:hypothetical protein